MNQDEKQDLEAQIAIIAEGCKISQSEAERLHAKHIQEKSNPFEDDINRLKEMAKAQKERAIAKKTRYFVSGKDKASGKD